jgi:fibrillarin-like rRNA methylase
MVKQVLVVHNKLIIYSEHQFDMVICKNKKDCQRLHHTLVKLTKKQKLKNVLFMGIATPATISNMYDVIKKNTGWPIEKIRRTSTRP